MINKLFKRDLILISLLFLFFQCKSQNKNINNDILGIWVGNITNETYRIPFSTIYHFHEGGKMFKINFVEPKKKETKWSISNTILKIDTVAYKFQLTQEKLILNDSPRYAELTKVYPARISYNKSEIQKILSSRGWIIEDSSSLSKSNLTTIDNLRFSNTNYFLQRNYIIGNKTIHTEYEQYCFSLEDYDNYFFIFKQGFNDSCGSYSMPVEQIIEIGTNYFKTIDWSNPIKPIRKYINSPRSFKVDDLPESNYFKICFENYIGQFYSVQTQYKGGQKAIRDLILREYLPLNVDSSHNGYVRIRFIINCEGKSGRFDIQEVDNNYKPTLFSPEIIEQLFNYTRKLDKWIPGPLKGKSRDCYKFLTYKLKEGKIIDVLP